MDRLGGASLGEQRSAIIIGAGTWTIAAGQSLAVFLIGPLPLEDLTCFLLTNTLWVFGMTLFMTSQGLPRARAIAQRLTPDAQALAQPAGWATARPRPPT